LKPTPREFFSQVINRWEGLFQDDPRDTGNWVTTLDGERKLIGTMRGITPMALANHLHLLPGDITVEMIKNVSPELAADIAMKGYFYGPKFDLLTWGPATAAIIDWGYMSGPGTAAKKVQKLIAVPADGMVGPVTSRIYNDWVADLGDEASCSVIRQARVDFFKSLKRPEYEKGWINRANWASPRNPEFWSQWQ
jgi:lysozyme family protein